jgi:acetate kinase
LNLQEQGKQVHAVPDTSILVINTGSSSLKFGLYGVVGDEVELSLEGLADGIGRDGGKLELKDAGGHVLRSEDCKLATQGNALEHATQWLADVSKISPTAIGHRVVHGGPRLTTHQRITPELLEELKSCVHFAPLHIPIAVELIERAERAYPGIPQFACFDTAFHTTIPEAAARFPIPRELFDEGIHRYGFHGLSYESIVHQLGDRLPSRTVIAHLGSGASLTAVKDGKSVDTTMGLTPTGGIPMATRAGDLDPGVLLYLMRIKHMDADVLEQLLNHDSGLKAISGGESDMRKLEAAADSGDQAAHLAIDIFCTAIRKQIAAYAAVLGGLDMLIFAGGIGEHSTRIRENVCTGLGFLGLSFEKVRIVPSQEDLQIARHCHTLTQQENASRAK